MSSVLVISAIIVAFTLSFLVAENGLQDSSFVWRRSGEAKALANACAETALEQIRSSSSYSGAGSLQIGEGNCTYQVAVLAGENRLITATSTAGATERKVKIQLDAVAPHLHAASWQEVSDF